MIFAVYYLAAMALAGAELCGRLRPRAVFTPPALPAMLWSGVLAASYALQVALAFSFAISRGGPFWVVAWNAGDTPAVVALIVTGMLQSYALLGLYRAKVSIAAILAGALPMAAISIATPVLTNSDLYAYVGNGILELSAYAPPAVPFGGELGAINAWWNVPVPPATYGPLWLVLAHALTAPWPSLLGKMLAFRLFGAATFGALLILLRAYGLPARILAIVALNPAFYFQYILNAHNDLLPAAIVVAAAIVANVRPGLAAIAIAVAASIKAPFALVGLPVLVRSGTPAQRALLVAASLLATAVLSWLGGGLPYFNALVRHVREARLENILHVFLALVAVVAIVAAVAGARRLRTVVWLLPMIGAYTTAWYAIWSLPYALTPRRNLVYFLLWFPFVSTFAEPSFARYWSLFFVLPAVVIAAYVYAQMRPARPAICR